MFNIIGTAKYSLLNPDGNAAIRRVRFSTTRNESTNWSVTSCDNYFDFRFNFAMSLPFN